MSLANGLSILFILSKNQLLALLIFAMDWFYLISILALLIFAMDWFYLISILRYYLTFNFLWSIFYNFSVL